jgi:2TM family of unknown function (DUF5676)
MAQIQSMAGGRPRAQSDAGQAGVIPIVTLGLSLSLFFVISYMICIARYLLLPGLPVQHASLSIFLPGFELLSWRSLCLGMAESFVWGWYIALVFGSLYNFFRRRMALSNRATQ